MRILFAGDVVGNRALLAVCHWFKSLKEQEFADFYIVNGENAAEGRGMTPHQARQLLDAGADCITLGNHAWGQWALAKTVETEHRIIRPANGPESWPGNSSVLLERGEWKLQVLSLHGNVFLKSSRCPFEYTKKFLETANAPVFIDFHAEATAEKQALAWRFDGKVSAVIGTHTHVQTADERILPGGTAYLTDVGMCGPQDGVIGMDVGQSLRRMADGLPAKYRCADGRLGISAVCLDIDLTGTARYIKRIQIQELFPGEWDSHEIPLPARQHV